MSPHYFADPARAKTVPREGWHAAPAAPEEKPPADGSSSRGAERTSEEHR
jgi:hypothetical protein